MKFNKLSVLIFSLFAADYAFAIDPVYEGANGIRAKVFTNCLKCHSSELTGSKRNGAPADVNWDTYAAAKAKAGRAIQRAVYTKDMPPGSSGLPILTSEQQAALLAWNSAGLPQSSTPTGSYSYDTNVLTINVVNVGVFTYKATMTVVPDGKSPTGLSFVLQGAQEVSDSSDNAAFYTPVFEHLHLPKIELIRQGAVQSTVSADLLSVKGSSPLRFHLVYYK